MTESALSPDRTADAAGYDLIDEDQCHGLQGHLEIIGRRWNSAIMLAAMRGAVRFSEYRAVILGISDRLLTLRLRELEQVGLIERTVVPTSPVQVRYRPTARGRGLMRALQPLSVWASDNPVSPADLRVTYLS